MKTRFKKIILILFISLISNQISYTKPPKQEKQKHESFLEKLKEQFRRSFLQDNFSTIVEKELYRSGKLSRERIENYIERLGIKTIINLKNKRSEDDLKLKKDMKKFKVNVLNIILNYEEKLSKKSLIKLLKIYQLSYKPILIIDDPEIISNDDAVTLYLLTQRNEYLIGLIMKKIETTLKNFTEDSHSHSPWMVSLFGDRTFTTNFKDKILTPLHSSIEEMIESIDFEELINRLPDEIFSTDDPECLY